MFTQSAMDVGFRWLEKELPGFRVYLFSDEACRLMQSYVYFALGKKKDAASCPSV